MSAGDLQVIVHPGQGVVARYGSAVLVVGPGGSQEVHEQILATMERTCADRDMPGSDMARAFVGILSQADAADVPAFGACAPNERGWALLLHKAVQIEVRRGSTTDRLSGLDASTWVDRIIDGEFDTLSLSPAGEEPGELDTRFRFMGGLVPGGGATLIQDMAAASAGSASASASDTPAAPPVGQPDQEQPAPAAEEGLSRREPPASAPPAAASPASWSSSASESAASESAASEPAASESAASEPAASEEMTADGMSSDEMASESVVPEPWASEPMTGPDGMPAPEPEGRIEDSASSLFKKASPPTSAPAAAPQAQPSVPIAPPEGSSQAITIPPAGASIEDTAPPAGPPPGAEPATSDQPAPAPAQPQAQPPAPPAQPPADPSTSAPQGVRPSDAAAPAAAAAAGAAAGAGIFSQRAEADAGPAPADDEPPTLITPPAADAGMPVPADPTLSPLPEDDVPYEVVALGDIGEDAARKPLPVLSGDEDKEEAVSDDSAPLVYGVLSPSGYFNHPDALYCAVTGVSMLHRTHVLVQRPRPPLGVVVADDGSTFTLNANYVVGREPDPDEMVENGDARPLKLTDAERSVSRVHAELRLSDWDVFVVDRESANGTYVLPKGAQQWQRLVAGNPEKIVPGTRIAFGKRVMTFESHHQISKAAS